MVQSIITIYGKEISIGKDYKNYFSGNFTYEKIVKFIQPINNSIHRIIFNDMEWIDVSNSNISKIIKLQE